VREDGLPGLIELARRTRHTVREQVTQARYRALFRKYRDSTMIPAASFVANCVAAAAQADVHGCVVECGVWRGGMSAALAEVLGPERTYYLFDSFEGLPPAGELDGPAAHEWQRDKTAPGYHDNCWAEQAFARAAMGRARARHVHYVQGWFEHTLPTFEPAAPIALLRLDADWYESTTLCLRHLTQFMAERGVIVVDDYYTWDGCARAVHEFLAGEGAGWRVAQRDNLVCVLQRQPRAKGQSGEATRSKV
jgi:O-methyltransferase